MLDGAQVARPLRQAVPCSGGSLHTTRVPIVTAGWSLRTAIHQGLSLLMFQPNPVGSRQPELLSQPTSNKNG